MDLMQSTVYWQYRAADAECMRLMLLAELSGALPGEVVVIWRFSSEYGGLWPFLA